MKKVAHLLLKHNLRNMSHSKTEILVIGGGPVGLASAISFAQVGFDVRIIDENSSHVKESRALAVHARTMEVFRNLGVVDEFLEKSFHVHRLNFHSEGKSIAQLSLDQLDTPCAAIFSLPQVRTEKILSNHLAITHGISIERNTELIDFENSEDKVMVKVTRRGDDGKEKEETIEIKYLIGCDGAHSTVRKKLGAQFEGLSIKNKWYFMDVEIDTDLPSCHDFNMIWNGPNSLLLIPMGENTYQVFVDSESTDVLDVNLTEEAYIKLAKDLISPFKFDVKKVIWFTDFQVNERKVKDYGQGRIFLCGDAAHIHSPAGGQGMNTGIQDGYNLAWKLGVIEHHHGRRSTLISSYTEERGPIASGVLNASGALLRTFLSNVSFLSSIRSQLVYVVGSIPFAREIATQKLVGFTTEYPSGPLTIPHGGWISRGPTCIKSGRRVPDITVHGLETKSLYDFFSKPTTFHLLLWVPLNSTSMDATQTLVSMIAQLRSTYDGATSFIEPLVITDETNNADKTTVSILKENFGPENIFNVTFDDVKIKFGFTNNDPVALIIRPNGYLRLAVYLQNTSQIDEYFKGFMS
ncbi:hypothetical protein K7432_013744 [Basidiobolus ranarum]|uniref:FAD-binding domain-containing protein n=1 Tax=Basidiobolus ranarum TaxID=34480 RepID=A0ABR2WIR2_9FUNG